MAHSANASENSSYANHPTSQPMKIPPNHSPRHSELVHDDSFAQPSHILNPQLAAPVGLGQDPQQYTASQLCDVDKASKHPSQVNSPLQGQSGKHNKVVCSFSYNKLTTILSKFYVCPHHTLFIVPYRL